MALGPVGGFVNKFLGRGGDIFVGDRADNEFRDVDPEGRIGGQARAAGRFAFRGEQGFGELGDRGRGLLDMLDRRAQGQDSLSAEQLRQGLQQNLAAQQAMAASARPSNSAAAARTAALQSARLGSGLAGQQAMAGIAERQAAEQSMGGLLSQLRQQDLQAALQSRQNALQGFGDIERARTSRFTGLLQDPTSQEAGLGLFSGLLRGGQFGGGF